MKWDDKNCTPNSVGLFWVQNQVIRAWLSTLLARGLLWWCPDPEVSSKFGQNVFSPYWLKMIRTAPKQCGFKTESYDPIFNFASSKPTLVVSNVKQGLDRVQEGSELNFQKLFANLIYSWSRKWKFFIQSIDYVILDCPVNNRLCTTENIRDKPRNQLNPENSLQ